MKIKFLTYLWLSMLACFCVSCGDEIENQERNYLVLDSVQFSDDYKTVYVNANVVGNPVMDDPSDTLKTRYRIFETSDIGDTLSAITAPSVIHVRNVAKEQMEQLDVKAVVIVDLTMEQEMVNAAKVALVKMRRLFPDGNIYVSFITDRSNISVAVPLSDDLLEHDFNSTAESVTEKYLYRNLYIMLQECCMRHNIPGRNKAIVLMSDGVVWGQDTPLDPDHFVIQQDLLDFAQQQSTKVPVFFAGMSTEESLSPETNTTMQLVCARTGGACTQGFDLNEMHSALCKVHNLDDVDLQYELQYPDERVFWGEPVNLFIECIQGDSLVAYGNRCYREGSLFEPITVNGMPTSTYVLFGFIQSAFFILLCYIILQFILPFVRYRIFKRKYIAPYTGNGMTIAGRITATNCYFCKAPFELGEMIVGRCEHTMHQECWDENGYHCTEYGVSCQDGSHFYDRHNLFNPANAPYYMRWILAALFSTILAWSLFYLVPGDTKSRLILVMCRCIMDEETALGTLDYVYRQPTYAFWGGFMFVGVIAVLVRRRLPLLLQIRDIVVRALVAGVGCYLCLFLDVLICSLLEIETANDIVGIFSFALLTLWVVFVVSYQTSIRARWQLVLAAYVLFVIGQIISTNYYWGVAFDFRVLQLVSHAVFDVILALAFAYDVRRSDHYFLHVEGAIKTMDIALYKWLHTSPSAVVTIGKSVDSNLQLSWDIESDVAPLQAEIRMRNGHPCLYACEDGVWKADDTPLEEGDSLRLYHGTKFRIGNTLFTYIEKDK